MVLGAKTAPGSGAKGQCMVAIQTGLKEEAMKAGFSQAGTVQKLGKSLAGPKQAEFWVRKRSPNSTSWIVFPYYLWFFQNQRL